MISIGVAGWDYADWNGIVYPATAGRGFDRLAWIARFVDAIEINATFYRPVAPRVAQTWIKRVASRASFRFTAKCHRSWTHEPVDDPKAVVAPTLAGLAPLHEAGLLGALLVQFPQSFHWTSANAARLSRLLDAVSAWPVVVEGRHVSWDDDRAAAFMHERAVGWCVVDQPRAGNATAPARPRVTASVAYLRLHGRNEGAWFAENAGRDARYDYLYSDAELAVLADAARGMASQANALYVIANNHFRGQALANALQLSHLIRDDKPEAPEELVAAYPALAEIVGKRAGRGLF